MRSERRRAAQRGQALVELALIAPVLIALLLGVVELGAALQAHITIINAAREGARLAGRGGIFSDAAILQVIEGQSRNVDIAAHGTVLLTEVKCEPTGFVSYTTTSLTGAGTSRFDAASLSALRAQLVASEPDYLGKERFVVVEIFYNHTTWTGVWGGDIPMYAYATMPVSAPS